MTEMEAKTTEYNSVKESKVEFFKKDEEERV